MSVCSNEMKCKAYDTVKEMRNEKEHDDHL